MHLSKDELVFQIIVSNRCIKKPKIKQTRQNSPKAAIRSWALKHQRHFKLYNKYCRMRWKTVTVIAGNSVG